MNDTIKKLAELVFSLNERVTKLEARVLEVEASKENRQDKINSKNK